MVPNESLPAVVSKVGLRLARRADLMDVLRLNQAALPAVNSVPIEFFERYLDSNGAQFRVAEDSVSGNCLGFLLALRPGQDYSSINYRWFDSNFRSFWYVDRIVISPEAQGRGLGQQFYTLLVKAAMSESPRVKRICCEVNIKPRNDASLRFHERFGFEKCHEQVTEGGQKVVRLLTYNIP